MFWKKISFRNYFLISGALCLISVVGILLAKGILPPVVPLFYGRPNGTDQLAPAYQLLIIPGVSLLITIINAGLNVSSKDEFINKVLAVSAIVISIIAAITTLKIIFLVGFF